MDQRSRRTLIALAPLAIALGVAAPAAAQLLPRLPLPSLPGVGPVVRDLERALPIDTPDLRELTSLRVTRLERLVRRHPRELELDDLGQAVVRGEILAISPSPQSLEIAAGSDPAEPSTFEDPGVLDTIKPALSRE